MQLQNLYTRVDKMPMMVVNKMALSKTVDYKRIVAMNCMMIAAVDVDVAVESMELVK